MAAINPSLPLATVPDSSADVILVPWARVERFVGQVIHDVRNGLNAIELQLTFLGEISTDPEAVSEVKHLRSTLLEITRQLQGVKTVCSPVTPSVMEYPAADLFEDFRERLARQQPEALGAVSWNVAPVPGDVLLVDPDLAINGLLELLKNALRFAGREIACATESEAASVSFVLRERPLRSLAIEPERWGKEPLLSSHRGALGLGLFRVRRILETQGGTLQFVYSEAENVLTTRASFPRAPRAA